jgi:TIR domain
VGARVFISYSSKDSKAAHAICSALESRKLTCWIASRDVRPGENFMDAIVDAINSAKTMVLVFSENANNSEEIKREIVLAGNARIPVIPVRVENVLPKGAFAYQLATRQWIDLFEDWENEIERLAVSIGQVVLPEMPAGGTMQNAEQDAGLRQAERSDQKAADERAEETAQGGQEAEAQGQVEAAEAQRRATERRQQEEDAKRRADEAERRKREDAEQERQTRGARARQGERAARGATPLLSVAAVPIAHSQGRGQLTALISGRRAPPAIGVLLALQGVFQLSFYQLVWSDAIGAFSFNDVMIWTTLTIMSAVIAVVGAISLSDVRWLRLIGIVISGANLICCLILLLPDGTLNALSYSALVFRQIINDEVGGIEDFAVNRSFTDWIFTVSAFVSAVCVFVLLVNRPAITAQLRTDLPPTG